MTETASTPVFELLDAGDGRRLDRFGARVVDRPAPSAVEPTRLPPEAWGAADLRFERSDPRSAIAGERRGHWVAADAAPWAVQIDGITVELRPTDSGQLGIYPEHRLFWPWLRTQLAVGVAAAPEPAAIGASAPRPSVLHLFASTGATTLALAAAGARVTHVDGARSAVAWARHNAALSGLGDAPIRWIVDDALTFTRREARRGRRYDGVVLDPPSFGHGPGGARWELRTALPALLDACADATTDDAWVLLTAHTTGVTPDELGDELWSAWGRGHDVEIEASEIEETATSGATLLLGAAARMVAR
jgi:23S rRNA (cytosine1962-C5)-methyltransferase